ncbi:MAG: acyl-CoA thioesterase [Lentisphaeria bacterium]|nr:acyl-CoA thioesterase [Candidatus Neomarinimicrobiota bacterium]MCF7842693.1 acyl-CoA thioesterase [Lentisphaeria bacterium]
MIKYRTKFTVDAADTDANDIMHYAKYLDWFEIARNELMRKIGLPFEQLEAEQGLIMPIIKISVSYIAGAKAGQELQCVTEIRDILHNRFEFFYSIRLDEDKESEIVAGKTRHIFASTGGKTTKLPPDMETVIREHWGNAFE